MISFHVDAWEDDLYWQRTDKQMLKRIHLLIKEIVRDPIAGIGKPEPLKFDFSGYWSRRIDDEHRIVYKIDKGDLVLLQLRYHYK